MEGRRRLPQSEARSLGLPPVGQPIPLATYT